MTASLLTPTAAMASRGTNEPPDAAVAPAPAPPTDASLGGLTVDGEELLWMEDGAASGKLRSARCTPGKAIVLTNKPNKMDVAYATAVSNRGSSAIRFKWSTKKTKTTRWSVSGSVTAEAKAAIFAKVSATVNGGIEKSNTTEYGAEVSGKVPAHTRKYGDYGNWKEVVRYKTAHRYSNCTYSTWKYGSFSAPYRENWKIWDKRI
ncbi:MULTISPECIES: hypothetical protein [unclassified Isoptericola]|uniref:hypothetical protein n=1 Tax=Isoptericola sp. NPDC057191 TaxID=3346041 RepID=UPI003644E074